MYYDELSSDEIKKLLEYLILGADHREDVELITGNYTYTYTKDVDRLSEGELKKEAISILSDILEKVNSNLK